MPVRLWGNDGQCRDVLPYGILKDIRLLGRLNGASAAVAAQRGRLDVATQKNSVTAIRCDVGAAYR